MSFFPKSNEPQSPRTLLEEDVRVLIKSLEIGDCINVVLDNDTQGRFILLGINQDDIVLEYTNAQRFQNVEIKDIAYIEKAPNPAFPVSGQKLGAAYHITMYGVCDQAHRNDLLAELDKAITLNMKNVIIRCNYLTGISSTGIALLITAYSRLTKCDISMCLVNTEPHVKKVLRNAAIDTIFNVF
ncbi:MAG: STAS domain-containing protein [Planctomycetes bacterium]|nr:STAS domain-containing protein [Planctomycetota bacterium]